MDKARLTQKLTDFIALCDELVAAWNIADRRVANSLAERVQEMLPAMERIADALEPGRPFQWDSGKGWRYYPARDVALRLRGLLADKDDIEEMLGPTGPRLSAAALHPWIWSAAASLWDNGHRRAAVQAAGVSVEQHLQAKIDRYDLSGFKLITEAFTLDAPAPGRPRLRFDAYPEDSESYKNAHTGAMTFGQGCIMAIRNLATHDLDEPEEQVALERLAALSVLARWIDEASLTR